jgi:hypothetical protein
MALKTQKITSQPVFLSRKTGFLLLASDFLDKKGFF